ncbi:NAD(P)-dependent dehydrogenase (short-subunit alcohol dehydrogenase family) [Granulicella aggregans]|uniref:NAD(P)-dependent dehydrogenase (Short-subunit alcohol dehydrogenase family) n=1 Tax=Granulicella aggregans TaxID=474949 RepID=A0A7W8E5M8_9BACT|nr:oxidoreductase [Granulicella aggregans]MBB5059464.1 NAD(P)-dependent dehydrogenase (short-subunit alcohol dehydrogenase family) [Granulicella aggregans]
MATKSTTKFTANDVPSQRERRVLITGANSGIGYEAALELARKGAEIIFPARSLDKANDAISRIRQQVPGAKITPAILDLASLASIRAFAARISFEFPGESLDLLINNAGVMAVPQRELTVDGYERQFATNYLGPFLLTALLYPHLKPQSGTRIVTVSSGVSNQGKIEFDNLQSERAYSPMFGAYSQSKLADLIFQQELQRRLNASGSPILSTGAHPGYAITNLQTSGPAGVMPIGFRIISTILKPLASQDAAHGAFPTLYAAVSPDVTPGGYYGPSGFQELKGYPVPAKIAPLAKDLALAKRLWSETERLVGVQFTP